MKLLVEWGNESLILEPDRTYTVGRDSSCDIILNNSRISKTHLRISRDKQKWKVTDLESTNGTFVNAKPSKVAVIDRTIFLHLGGVDNFVLKLTPLVGTHENERISSPHFIEKDETQVIQNTFLKSTIASGPMRVRLQQRIRIGRGVDNDWVIDDLNVSRSHAEIIQSSEGGFEIVDLKSTNGTFINENKIKREKLIFGDIISICGHRRKFTSDGLEVLEGIEGLSLALNGVSFKIGNKTLLDGVSFNLGPRTLTAVIGPSGAGKSTLLGVLTGRTRPTTGSVTFGGHDLHANFQILSRQIGSVPQADILHTRLTVRQALSYGAKLRLPNDTSGEERFARVKDVMDKLELSERSELRIDRLSGGQRKRASIGLELLTSPKLLVLDEPTSGLDPGLDAHVMETLRGLADDGQTVVLVTHSVDNLNFCDNVILLASGGRVAYAGPASTVFSKLGKRSWAEVFKFLASPEALLLASSKRSEPISGGIRQNLITERRQGFVRQIATLSARYFRVISSDYFYLALLTLIPIIIGLISYAAGSKYGFGPGYKTKSGLLHNPFAQGSVLVLILGSIFVGLSTSIQEVVKENAIRRREVNVGIRVITYFISKVIVLGCITSAQIIVFTTIVLFGRPLPQTGLFFGSSRVEITSLCISLGLCSMLLGLLVSSLLTSEEQAMPALVGMTMILVVLSGALPLENAGIVSKISRLVPSYWSTNGLAASVDLIQLSSISDKTQQLKWEASLSNLILSLNYVLLFCIFFSILSVVSLRKKL